MSIFEKLGNALGLKKRISLKSLPIDDLRREHISVKSELEKLEVESEKLEEEESQRKEEYKAAHLAKQENKKRAIALKIQNLQVMKKGLETRLAYTNRMFQTVAGLLMIKENMEFFNRLGVGSLISNMDMVELEKFIQSATVEGTLQQEKLAMMLQSVTDGTEMLAETAGESTSGAFMSELDAELGLTTEKDVEKDAEKQAAKELDALLNRGMEAARKVHEDGV